MSETAAEYDVTQDPGYIARLDAAALTELHAENARLTAEVNRLLGLLAQAERDRDAARQESERRRQALLRANAQHGRHAVRKGGKP